jgi:hypothetical protein
MQVLVDEYRADRAEARPVDQRIPPLHRPDTLYWLRVATGLVRLGVGATLLKSPRFGVDVCMGRLMTE